MCATAELPYTVYEVFTPTSSPAAFLERPEIQAAISRALAVPGRQLLVYGETGSGKSTALTRQLDSDYLMAHCTPETTVDSLVRAALASFGIERRDELSIALPRLAHELGTRGLRVVVEDAHRLAPSERARLMSSMKVFSDLATEYPTLMIIAVAAIESASTFSAFDIELSSRIAEVRVPPMTLSELEEVVRRGGELLNVATDSIAHEIALRSGGLPSIAHSLALSCFIHAGVAERASERSLLPSGVLGRAILERLARMPDHIASQFESATSRQRYRDGVSRVLTQLSLADPAGIRISELSDAIRNDGANVSTEHVPDLLDMITASSSVLKLISRDRVKFSSGQLHSYWRLLSQQPELRSMMAITEAER
ncbi:hypothetical protein BH11ACT2_BH11ACT2_09760 [soil metagenome]